MRWIGYESRTSTGARRFNRKNNSPLIQKSNDASVYDSFLLTRVNRRRRKALRLTFLQMSLGNSGFRP